MRPPTIQEAKNSLTIPVLWVKLGLGGRPRRSCSSPFREDHKPSFSVYDDGKHWRDFSTGEGGDAIDFIAKAKGINPKEAFKLFLNMARESGRL